MPRFTAANLAVTRRKRNGRHNGASHPTARSQNPSERSCACDNDVDVEANAVGHGNGAERSFSNSQCIQTVMRRLHRCFEIVQCSRLSYKQARRVRKGGISFMFSIALYVTTTFCMALLSRPSSPRPQTLKHLEDIPIVLNLYDFSTVTDPGGWLYPSRPFPSFGTLKRLKTSKHEDYGGLEFESVVSRKIKPDDELVYDTERTEQMEEMDNHSDTWHEEELEFDERECRPPSWASDYYPNCNSFHEVDLTRSFEIDEAYNDYDKEYDSHEFSHGYYREAWLVETLAEESWVLKMVRYKRKFGARDLEIAQKDAVVMEKLTGSPNIVDIYGHCATSINVEAMDDGLESYMVPGDGYIQQEDLHDSEDVDVQNSLTNTEKLQLALEMAESIAGLHGYEGGVIVHDDVQPIQWMRSKNGKLKLGDFNRAQILEWNDEKQEYCKFVMGGDGNYRAPEEFAETDCDEKIDVFSFGNNIYALLTGLWVFYEIEDYETVQEKVIDKELPFVDDRYRRRSFAERKLVEIMEQCWKYDPAERIDIFQAVKILRAALKQHLRFEAENK